MGIDLPLIWYLIIGFGLMMYVFMDGFDLGIGILFPFIKNPEERDVMINSVAPVWDGNETWLVLCGAGLLAAFPLAYSVILTALYIPLVLMLCGLIWRGVAFEFRFKASEKHKPFWDKAFIGGSYIATFFQGVTLGAFINGIKLNGLVYVGNASDWLTPFSLFTGLGLIITYTLLGCSWLIMKTEGELQKKVMKLAKPTLITLLCMIVLVSIITPLTHTNIFQRWFTFPNIFLLAPFPLLALVAGGIMLRVLQKIPHLSPFILTLFIIFMGYIGLAISIWPNIVPPSLTYREIAAPNQSMGFALVGALLVIPCILFYTMWSYYVFRGKVKVGEGYH